MPKITYKKEKNDYKITTIVRKYLFKDIENVIIGFKINDKPIAINLPTCFKKLTDFHEIHSLFISNLANKYYDKIKYLENIGFKFHSFSEFIRASFIDYILNNKKITDYLYSKYTKDNKDKVIDKGETLIIGGKIVKLIKTLDDY